jgi:cbb3-type cytochrome c oxidase subunit III
MNDEQIYRRRTEWAVFIGSGMLFILVISSWIGEGTSREWRRAQREYKQILRERTEDPGVLTAAFERGIIQTDLAALNRVDRCASCHLGLDDPGMAQVPQPHGLHPGDYLKDHPVQQYGCTICHGGQGRALTAKEAHGRQREVHWTFPLLDQPYIQSSCGKCHLSIFDRDDNNEIETVPGMEVLLHGKTLFSREGCLGCHQARGLGGILGPDLTHQGEKTKHEYSFQHVRGEQTISNWLKEHFKDPEMVSPGSEMLAVSLDEGELSALATFVMGLSKPGIPYNYFSMASLSEFKGIRASLDGNTGFGYLCTACHGKEGEGKDYSAYETGIPAIGNTDFLRVASGDFIRFTLEKGRSLRQMGSWSFNISGLHPAELENITTYLKGMHGGSDVPAEALLSGDPQRGSALFERLCKTCHGEQGEGGIAVALSQPGFLSRADDRFILQTLLRGRGNTAMPSWANLTPGEIADLVTHLRSWGIHDPGVPDQDLVATDLEEGALKYHYLCSRCHGEFGEGETGPAIINRDFLEVAGDRFLYETIAEGRMHTAMFGWSSDVYNQEQLSGGDIANIIGFMRASSQKPLTYIYQGSNPGRSEEGKSIFTDRCAECHGPSGEGVKAPALNNQEFLSGASNGYLMATVTLGRKGTAMPSWGYGQEGYPSLTATERQDVVAYLRSWQRIRIRF